MPAAIESAVLRIVQEALTNVIKHAHAHHCVIAITLATNPIQRQTIDVSITDDGNGLPFNRIEGSGMKSIATYARDLEGWCDIGPGPQSGTQVHVQIPINPTDASLK